MTQRSESSSFSAAYSAAQRWQMAGVICVAVVFLLGAASLNYGRGSLFAALILSGLAAFVLLQLRRVFASAGG